MFLACLMYGYMPGMATANVFALPSEMHGSTPLEKQTGHHGEHAMDAAGGEASGPQDPCPHKDTMTHAPFCAACLVLLPELTFAEKGQAPHAAPMPHLQRAFIGNLLSPPLPPPRA